ncbi:hypothetical protein PSEUDO8O_170566 [Pseudomonas sp. 8O]|nr:hypothetical protein PSEUDO8O_170566 [Pseudomonas sp. 8O]
MQPATPSWRVAPALHAYRSTSLVDEKNDHAEMNEERMVRPFVSTVSRLKPLLQSKAHTTLPERRSGFSRECRARARHQLLSR